MSTGTCVMNPEVDDTSEVNKQSALVPKNVFVLVFLGGPL
jgi:hypothetical protein